MPFSCPVHVNAHRLCRGQSIKVYSQLLRKARTHDYLLPNMKVGVSRPLCVLGG